MADAAPITTRDGVVGFDGSEVVTIDQASGGAFARYPAAGEQAAVLIHAESGKPLDGARGEVLATLAHPRFAIDNAERVLGCRDVPVAPVAPNQRARVEYHPFGVVTD